MREWIRLQKDLFRRTKREADRLLGAKPKSLIAYERRFRRDQKGFSEISPSSFVTELNRADYFFLGDFHTLRQSQRTLLRLLRDPKILPPKVLGFEILTEAQAKRLPKLLKRGSDSGLKDLLKLEETWGSSYETYRELFELAIKRGIEITGLSQSRPSLETRDQMASKKIAAIQKRMWILFGEYHCARPHLPGLVQNLRPESNIIILQQNDDDETMKRLLTLSQKKSLFLESRSNQMGRPQLYCMLHTPTWMKWQSFIERHLLGADDDDILPESIDAQEQLSWCLRTLFDFLKDARYPLHLALKDILDFHVYAGEDAEFAKALGALPPKERKSVLAQLQAGNLGVAAESRRIFLTEMTLNACAHAASSYLFRRCTEIQNQDTDFFRAALVETMSFFLSKILNHSRRAQTWKDWAHLAATSFRKKEAWAVLKTRDFPMVYSHRHRWLKSLRYSEAKLRLHLGRTLADALFEAFLAQEFSKNRILRTMTTPLLTEREAFEVLVEIKSVGEAFSNPRQSSW